MTKLRRVDPLAWLLVALVTVARLLAWAAGLGVNLDAISSKVDQHTWQLLDLNLLRHDLLSATGSLLMQPPLYNLLVGLLLHLSPDLRPPIVGFSLFACAMATTLATYATLKLLGIVPVVAMTVTVILVIADPATILFSSYLFYAAPTAALVTLTAWAAVRLLARPSWQHAATFGGIAAVLAMFNTSYQPLVIVLIFVAIASTLRTAWRSILLGFALPALVLVLWAASMWIQTGMPTTSTWLGMNLAHVTTGASPRALVRQLIADGTVAPTALVPAFSSLRAYGITPVTSGPAAQAQVTRSDGQPNLNNPGYEVASSRSLRDDLAFIASEPGRYLATVEHGVRIWAIPGDQYYFFDGGTHLSGYDEMWDRLVDLQLVRDPYLPLLILAHQATPLDQISWTEVVLGLLSLIGAPVIAVTELRRRRRLSCAILVVWGLLAQAFLVSSLTEYGENNRFRFETGTLRITLSVVVVVSVVGRLRRNADCRDERLEAAGWSDDGAVEAQPAN